MQHKDIWLRQQRNLTCWRKLEFWSLFSHECKLQSIFFDVAQRDLIEATKETQNLKVI